MGVENRQSGVCGSNLTLRNVYLKFLLCGQIPLWLQILAPVVSLRSFIDSQNKACL